MMPFFLPVLPTRIDRSLTVLRTLPGRLFLLTTAVLLLLALARAIAPLPEFLEILRKVARLAWFVSLAWILAKAFVRGQRQWLWAVRRKLILSYVFFGVFPVALIVVFVLVAGAVLYWNAAAYMFHTGYNVVVDDARQVGETTVTEIAGHHEVAPDVLARKVRNLAARYPGLSMAALSLVDGQAPDVATAGPWRHVGRPTEIPRWIRETKRVWTGTLAVVDAGAGQDELLVARAVVPADDGREWVVVDVPVDSDVAARLHDETGAWMGDITFRSDAATAKPLVGTADTRSAATQASGATGAGGMGGIFRRTVVMMDFTDWATGVPGRASISLEAPVGQLYERLAAYSTTEYAPVLRGNQVMLVVLGLLAILFLVIQASAFIGGVTLARRITSAVHSLFIGTARIGQGDFTHRIPIGSGDQLGDLAGSFNNMSASIEHLRQVEREKLRLDEELQIARRIQQSLLPAALPVITGLSVADLCEPAMEVGGDYYDVFALGPRRLGVLVADVSGKGTSAALYMAELKGLVLALSRAHRSPRALLIELNELLADHLDNRSFITMTYAIADLDAGTLTAARAGHTPLLVSGAGGARLVVPDGMVLGLRLPGAHARFSHVLAEYTQPFGPGDAVVLYTDGITEAMNEAGELFGETALCSVVEAHRDLDAAGIRERIVRDVRAFVGAAEPHDDMTMVVVKRTGMDAA